MISYVRPLWLPRDFSLIMLSRVAGNCPFLFGGRSELDAHLPCFSTGAGVNCVPGGAVSMLLPGAGSAGKNIGVPAVTVSEAKGPQGFAIAIFTRSGAEGSLRAFLGEQEVTLVDPAPTCLSALHFSFLGHKLVGFGNAHFSSPALVVELIVL